MIKRVAHWPVWLLLTAGFLVWRSALFLVAAVAPRFLPYQPSFPYADVYLLPSGLPAWLSAGGNFDGVHYLGIVKDGYHAALVQAFFPVFPLLIKLLSFVIPNPLLAGLLLSNLLAGVFCIIWYLVVKRWSNPRLALLSLVIIMCFPTSFFLGALYTESLFLVLIITTFWAARQKHWLMAGVLAGLASATRVVGIGLIPALVIEWADQQGYLNLTRLKSLPHTLRLSGTPTFIRQHAQFLLSLGLGCLGLLSYMAYLWLNFHDPLAFLHVQSGFGAGRQSTLVLYPQVVWRAFKILLTSPHDLKYVAYLQEFAFGLGGGGLVIWSGYQAFRHRQPWSHWLFAFLAFLLPTTTGTFSSMGRYVLVCFIFWLTLADYLSKHRWLMIGYLLLSTALLVVNIILFTQGYWVA